MRGEDLNDLHYLSSSLPLSLFNIFIIPIPVTFTIKVCFFFKQLLTVSLTLSHFWCWWCQSLSRVQLFATPCTIQPTRLLCPWILQARMLEWVAISFSRRIFWTQGSNSGLLHCRQIFYHLSHQGSPPLTTTGSANHSQIYHAFYMHRLTFGDVYIVMLSTQAQYSKFA